MKKKIFNLSLIFLMCISALFFCSCSEQKQPYIKVSGIKTEYCIGDTLSLSNAKINYYNDTNDENYSQQIAITDNMVSGFSTTTTGTFKMTFSYNNLTTELTYIVREKEPIIKVEGIAKEYYVGDSLILENVKAKYYADKNDLEYTEFNVTTNMVYGFSTDIPGTFTMTITAANIPTTIEYVVLPQRVYTREEATSLFKNAIESTAKSDMIQKSMIIPFFGNVHEIITKDIVYETSNFSKCWTIKENGIWYDYKITSITVNDEPSYSYTKTLSYKITGDDARSSIYSETESESPELIPELIYEKTEKINGDYIIYFYQIENSVRMDTTITIRNEKTHSIVMTSNEVTISSLFYTYNEISIPELPTDVEWVEK